ASITSGRIPATAPIPVFLRIVPDLPASGQDLEARSATVDNEDPRIPSRKPVGISELSPMPQSIPRGLTGGCILQALSDLDAGIENALVPPTGYGPVHEGRRYPPKAVIGLACRPRLGRILRPEEFSGGEASGLLGGSLPGIDTLARKRTCLRRTITLTFARR